MPSHAVSLRHRFAASDMRSQNEAILALVPEMSSPKLLPMVDRPLVARLAAHLGGAPPHVAPINRSPRGEYATRGIIKNAAVS
jgi:hypothetical protein